MNHRFDFSISDRFSHEATLRIASQLFYSKWYRCLISKFYSKIIEKNNQKMFFFLQLAFMNFFTGGLFWKKHRITWLQQERIT